MHTQFCIAHRIGLSYSLFFESATFLSEPTMQSCVLHLSWNIWILPTVKKTPMSTSRQPLFTENPLSHNRLQNLCFPLLWTYLLHYCRHSISIHALCISVIRVVTLFVLFLWLCVVGTTGLYSMLSIFFVCISMSKLSRPLLRSHFPRRWYASLHQP